MIKFPALSTFVDTYHIRVITGFVYQQQWKELKPSTGVNLVGTGSGNLALFPTGCVYPAEDEYLNKHVTDILKGCIGNERGILRPDGAVNRKFVKVISDEVINVKYKSQLGRAERLEDF